MVDNITGVDYSELTNEELDTLVENGGGLENIDIRHFTEDQQSYLIMGDPASYADGLTQEATSTEGPALTAEDIYAPAVVNLMDQYNGCTLVNELQNLTLETNQVLGSTTPVSDYLQEEHGFGVCPETGSAEAKTLNNAIEEQSAQLDDLHQLKNISITG